MKKGDFFEGQMMKADSFKNYPSLFLLLFSLFLLVGQKFSEYKPGLSSLQAADNNTIIGVQCTEPAITALVPTSFTITVAPNNPSAAAFSGCSASSTLGGAIDGDTADSVTCSFASEMGRGLTRMPNIKVGGIQCSTYTESPLEINGDGTDNTGFDFSLQNFTDANYDAADKWDAVTSGSKRMLWGTSGTITTSKPLDANDVSGANGEITFQTNEAQGRGKIGYNVDLINQVVDGMSETMTLTFTVYQ